MPDLLASASLLPLTPAIAPRAGAVAVPAVGDFMAMLGDLVLPAGGKPQGGKGQAIAGNGKNLPVEGVRIANDEDEPDPLVAWLPAGLVPLAPSEPAPLPAAAFIAEVSAPGVEGAVATAPVATAPVATAPVATAPVATAHAVAGPVVAAPVAEAATPVVLPGMVEIPVPPADGPPVAPITDSMPVVPAVPKAPVADPMPADAPAGDVVTAEAEVPPAPETAPRAKAEAPVREVVQRPVPVQAPTLQAVIPGAPAAQTAGQVFAAAISASFDSPAALRTVDPVTAQTQAAATEQLRTTVQAMSGADQAPLDMSRDDWAGKMVDRIATLREAAEAADTRIRLAPENLGNVEVSIRREGDRLHVHFCADNPAARQLLAEAAPRLAELAEARGVKLGQTSVDAGAGGQQGRSSQPQPNQPARPAAAGTSGSQSNRDGRVA